MISFRLLLQLALITALYLTAFLAQALELAQWQPTRSHAVFVIPKRETETPEDAARRFLQALQETTALQMESKVTAENFPAQNVAILQADKSKVQVFLLANHDGDHSNDPKRIRRFTEPFAKAGAQIFVVPIGASGGLSDEEALEFRDLLAQKSDLMVAMGGDDVDPSLYREKINGTHENDVNHQRDVQEMALIRAYIQAGKGFFLGVCRGSQLTSVTLGLKMIQDLPTYLPHSEVKHGGGYQTHDILIESSSEILLPLLSNRNIISVVSYHHQAVIYDMANPHLNLVARAKDGITEATEFTNGRGLLVQFHPEDMHDENGAAIMNGVIARAHALKLP